MGTAVALASIHTSTIKLSPGERAFWYWLVWVVSIIGIAIVLWAALRSKRWARWTTQDVLIVRRWACCSRSTTTDSGSICVGCHCLILPPVPPGATRGLRAAAGMARVAWAE
jgi:hypothetical protein